MARLSTHVLDLGRGAPGAGIRVELYEIRDSERILVKSAVTNQDGRTDEPLLKGAQMPSGVYELVFYAADYLRQSGEELPDPPFLDDIVIRFGIAESAGNYHVPLLLSRYGYSTYRGS